MYCCKVNSRLLTRFTPVIRRTRRLFSTPAVSEREIDSESLQKVAVPVINENESMDSKIKFPPIFDLSRPARRRREREEWHEKVKKLGTVEEKIFELNMPRYYGWKVCKIEEGSIPYDPLPKVQYITKTHIVEEPGLPSYYNNIVESERLDTLTQLIKSQIEEVLAFEHNCIKRDYQLSSDQLEDKSFMDNLQAKSISQQINRILISNLSPNYNHLLDTQTDIEPRNEAFWFFGGFEVPNEVRKARRGGENNPAKEWETEPVNQCIQYKGSPVLQLRHHLPLKEIMPLEDCEDPALEVPVESLDPRKTGYIMDRLRATVIPGFWPGDHHEFGIVSYHNRGHLQRRPEQFNDNLDALKAQAVLGSFSWLYGQACYQGFSTFQDPTYPLVNQSIITNGQSWTFSVYQLNTTTLHIDAINENPKRNVCWVTEPMKLYDSIENGKVEGLNEDILKHLIKFYANTPEIRKNIEMKPYLKQGEGVVAGIEDPKRRKWLEDKYKHLISNRPRHRTIPEIYHWQKIYLIDNKTRPLEKKREPWQFGINVYQRRLDDHSLEYVPKKLRENKKSKIKFTRNYYPEVRESK